MAESCAKFARSLPGVEHMTAKIPWSTPPFPERPGQGDENVARTARYDMLLRCMISVPAANDGPVNVIAVGHHADDQVETALMRFGMGSTVLGAAGMRPCRRWGMGAHDADGLGWAGLDGMNKWIVRPLLDAPKVCHSNSSVPLLDAHFRIEYSLRARKINWNTSQTRVIFNRI